MKKLSALMCLGLIFGPDMALADDPVKFPNWNGAYVGASAGYQAGSVKTRTTSGNYPVSTDLSGGAVSVNAGYNVQNGRIVFGLEAELNGSNLDGKWECAASPGVNCRFAMDISGSLRGRLGLAVGQALIYGTAGVAFAEGGGSIDPVTGLLAGKYETTYVGPTLGAGLEYALTNQISVKTEYLYTNWGNQTSSVNSVSAGDPYMAFPETHTVKIGVNYRF